MGELFDDLLRESEKPAGRPVCSLAKIKERMTADEQADLDKVLTEPRIFGSAIARKLTSVYGISIKGATVQRHRNGECSCE